MARVIDAASPTPKHVQLREILLELIAGGLAVNEPLPSERELADRFGVARMTARKTVDQLVADGEVYRVPGRGAFVARPHLVMPLALTSFTEDIRARGMRPGSVVLFSRLEPAGAELASALRLDPGAPVHVLERLRLADDEPIALERTHLPAGRTPGLLDEPLVGRSLYAILEQRYGLLIDGGEQVISGAVVDDHEAKLLKVPRRSAALRFQRRADAGGAPIEYAVSTYRGDRYHLRVSFGRTAPVR